MTATTEKFRFWCDMSLECVRRDHTKTYSPGDQTGPFRSARALGMALAALHDAHALGSGRNPLLKVSAPPGMMIKNSDLASAAACSEVLQLRYPNQKHLLEPAWLHWLNYFEMGPAGSTDELLGRDVGREIHNKGDNDVVNAADGQYKPTGAPYTHIAPPTQPGQGYAGGKWGQAAPLLASRVTQFPPPPGRVSPTTVTHSDHYVADFIKVVDKGNLNQAAGVVNPRSLQEEVTGIAWAYDAPPEIGTPPRLYMQIILTILDTIEARNPSRLSVEDQLLILAGTAIAMADAGIDAWHYKYAGSHMMWRPIVGIRNAVPGNGDAVPNWMPLGRPDTNGSNVGLTPDFPAYPSGHATFGAAAFQLLRLFLAEKGLATFDPDGVDNVRFDFLSDEYNGKNSDPRTMQPRPTMTLTYSSLWQAITENSVSRVYLGVHWQFDGITRRNAENSGDEFGIPNSPIELGRTGGVWLGTQIANQIALSIGVSSMTIAQSKM